MLLPSDINQNVYTRMFEKYNKEREAITKTPLSVHKKSLIGGALLIVAGVALHNIFPPSLYPSALFGFAKLSMFLGGICGTLGSVVIGEGKKAEAFNVLDDTIRTVVETRDLNKSIFYTPEGNLRDLQDAKNFETTKVDFWHSRGSLLNHHEGYKNLGELIDDRAHSTREDAKDYVDDHRSRAMNNARWGREAAAGMNIGMAALSMSLSHQKEQKIINAIICDYCYRREMNPSELLKKVKEDKNVLYTIELEKIDTLAYHIEMGKEQVKKVLGENNAELNFANNPLLQKRLEGFAQNPESQSLSNDEIVKKVNEAKKSFLVTGGGFVMKESFIPELQKPKIG